MVELVEGDIAVEVVYAMPERQIVVRLHVPPGTTVGEAIEHSAVTRELPAVDLHGTPVGTFGRLVSRDALLRDGDRVELYRPLVADPKKARRERAGGRRSASPRASPPCGTEGPDRSAPKVLPA